MYTLKPTARDFKALSQHAPDFSVNVFYQIEQQQLHAVKILHEVIRTKTSVFIVRYKMAGLWRSYISWVADFWRICIRLVLCLSFYSLFKSYHNLD